MAVEYNKRPVPLFDVIEEDVESVVGSRCNFRGLDDQIVRRRAPEETGVDKRLLPKIVNDGPSYRRYGRRGKKLC